MNAAAARPRPDCRLPSADGPEWFFGGHMPKVRGDPRRCRQIDDPELQGLGPFHLANLAGAGAASRPCRPPAQPAAARASMTARAPSPRPSHRACRRGPAAHGSLGGGILLDGTLAGSRRVDVARNLDTHQLPCGPARRPLADDHALPGLIARSLASGAEGLGRYPGVPDQDLRPRCHPRGLPNLGDRYSDRLRLGSIWPSSGTGRSATALPAPTPRNSRPAVCTPCSIVPHNHF